MPSMRRESVESMMKKVVLSGSQGRCPCCGALIYVSATVRLKGVPKQELCRPIDFTDIPERDEGQERGDGA